MKKLFIYAGIALGLLVPGLLRGQEIGLLRTNLENRPEFEGTAAVWGGVEEGGYRPAYAAPFQWSAGAEAKAVRHGKYTSWKGALSFEQVAGQNMFSSMFMEPGYYPLDLLEFTKGPKSRQNIRLEGGFLTDFGYDWAAGIKATVKASNIMKQEHVHHTNFGISAQVEPTLTFVMDDDMGLASSYIVRLRTESIKASPDGEGEHILFLDKGLRYGSYVDVMTGFSVQELAHGISELFYSPEFTMGAEIIWKRGKVGEDQFRFPGSTLSLFAEYAILADNTDHVMRLGFKRQRDQLRMVTEDGFAALSGRRVRNMDMKYEAKFLHGVLKSAGIVLNGNQWFENAFVTCADQILRYDGTVTFLTSLSFGAIDLDVHYLAGKGWWKDRGQDAVDGDENPDRATGDWLRKMDYMMAPRMAFGGTITARIPAVKGLFFQLNADWHHAFNVTLLRGKNREIASLKVGYKF